MPSDIKTETAIITPEMLKAGVLEFSGVDLSLETVEDAVTSIFLAMIQAK